MTTNAPAFSIIVPWYNEQDGVDDLITAIEVAMQPVTANYEESSAIDDGSTDATLEDARSDSRTRARNLRVFSFQEKSGQVAGAHVRLPGGNRDITSSPSMPTFRTTRRVLPADVRVSDSRRARRRRERVAQKRRDSMLKVLSSRVFNLIVIRMLFNL